MINMKRQPNVLVIFLICSFCLLEVYGTLHNRAAPSESSKQFNEVLKAYDKRVRPHADNGAAEVTLQISVVAIGPINEKDFTFRIDYFMRQWWTDDRLRFSNQTGEVTFNGNPKDVIWLPDLFIRNSRQLIKHTSTTDTIRTTVYNDGRVYMSSRISAINSCNMDLKLYPMDSQTCKMIFESYAYNGHDLSILWHKFPIEYKMTEIQIEGYALDSITTSNESVIYITGEFFPLLQINIHVHRTLSYYIFRSYVPSSFLVIMTWGTFWLPATTYPARVGIIVTNFLASAFILQGASAMYTKVPYTTAIEVYLLVNITYILAVMLEYIAVIQIPNFQPNWFHESLAKTSIRKNSRSVGTKEIFVNGKKVEEQAVESKIKKSFNTHFFDRASRIAFPSIYCLFLLAYFIKYKSH